MGLLEELQRMFGDEYQDSIRPEPSIDVVNMPTQQPVPALQQQLVVNAAKAQQQMAAAPQVAQQRPQVAPQQVARETPKQQTFSNKIMSSLQRPETWAGIAANLNTLRRRPDQAFGQAMMKRVESAQAAKRQQDVANKTIEYLRKNGMDGMAEFIKANPSFAKEAISNLLKTKDKTAGVVVGKSLINPYTGEVIYSGGAEGPEFADESSLRKEFSGLQTVKKFSEQASAFGRIQASAEDPSAAGDLALIFNYMKVLDPGSTVREGEFANAQNAGGVPSRVVGMYNRVISGERLSPDQRADFVDRASKLYSNAEQGYKKIEAQYKDIAKSYGMDPSKVITNFAYQGSKLPPLILPKSLSSDLTQADWNLLSADEKVRMMEGM